MNKGGFDIRKYSFLLTQARAAKLDFKNLDKEQFVRDFRQNFDSNAPTFSIEDDLVTERDLILKRLDVALFELQKGNEEQFRLNIQFAMDSADKIKNEIGFRKLQKAQRASSAGGHAKAANRQYTPEGLQENVNSYHKKHPQWSYAQIKRSVAKDNKCSEKTVTNNTTNPHKIKNS